MKPVLSKNGAKFKKVRHRGILGMIRFLQQRPEQVFECQCLRYLLVETNETLEVTSVLRGLDGRQGGDVVDDSVHQDSGTLGKPW